VADELVLELLITLEHRAADHGVQAGAVAAGGEDSDLHGGSPSSTSVGAASGTGPGEAADHSMPAARLRMRSGGPVDSTTGLGSPDVSGAQHPAPAPANGSR